MRKILTIFNSLSGLLNKLVSIIFVFWVRWYFTRNLDIQLLGLEGLFSNILGVFSLVDAGFGTAISFSLFKPLHDKERNLVGAIMHLYRKVYTVMGLIIIGMSIVILPIIPMLIKGTTVPTQEIRLFFLVYSISVGISYFFAYKRTLLFSMQKNYLAMNVDTIIKLLQSVFQIISITIFQSYIIYLVCSVFFSFLANLICSFIANREDAYDRNCKSQMPDSFKKNLIENIKSLAVTNISWIGISSTDNIIISSVVGVIDLAKNANYSTLVNSISGVVSVFLGGVSASIGDLLVTENKTKIKDYFKRYNFIYQAISGYVSLGFLFVSEPVISLWVGENYVFKNYIVVIISANIFLTLIFKPLADYQNYSGLFIYYKPYSIVALFINLFISYALSFGKGISGVFLGTTLTYIFMIASILHILYKHLFDDKCWDYLQILLREMVVLVLSAFVLYSIPISCTNLISLILIKILLVSLIYFGMLTIFFCKEDSFVFLVNFLKDISLKILRRRTTEK